MADEGRATKKGSGKKNQKVPFYKLFAYSDRLDIALIIVGTISAIGNGLAQPIMTLMFGEMINSFGGTDPSHVVHEVSKVSLKYVYLAIGAGIASFLQMSCWMVSGERRASRIRGLYLRTLLRQDIEFFDLGYLQFACASQRWIGPSERIDHVAENKSHDRLRQSIANGRNRSDDYKSNVKPI